MVCTINVGAESESIKDAAVLFNEGPLKDFFRLAFDKMDGWFEEDDPIYGHPADPYKRIDIRCSTRPIRVVVSGKTVAESSWAMHLYETGLPVRYYLPKTAVRWDLLRQSDTRTFCPYKGHAQYYHIVVDGEVQKDLVWWYQTSPLEASAVQNMVSASYYSATIKIDLRSYVSTMKRSTSISIISRWRDQRQSLHDGPSQNARSLAIFFIFTATVHGLVLPSILLLMECLSLNS